MGYVLGIDLGTTFTAAAVGRSGWVEVSSLGNRSASVPSVVFLRGDETILTGEPAERRAMSDPGRVAREFKRRIGDPTPILLGGTPYSAEALMGKLLRWTVDAVGEREGGPPERVAVTHPANWGPYKKDLFDGAVRLADLDDVERLTEPEAAAIYYASNERVDVGAVVAVYDLGGGTFDATVLRKAASGFEILGTPEGIERLGGIDLDEAVFAHVDRLLDGALTTQDPSDSQAVAAVGRIRQECTAAKEALSTDTDTVVPVMLPGLQTEVRLTRGEFEAMVRPALTDTIGALHRALRSADLGATDVDRVLLVGGSSRIPLVAEMVSAELGRPVAVDAHPKYAVALGAALAATATEVGEPTTPDAPAVLRLDPPVAAQVAGGTGPIAPPGEGGVPPQDEPTAPHEPSLRVIQDRDAAPPVEREAPPPPSEPEPPGPEPRAAPEGGPPSPPPPPTGRERGSRGPAIAIAALIVAALAVSAFALFRPGGTGPERELATTETAVPTAAPGEGEGAVAAEPTAGLPTPPPGVDLFARINDITVDDGTYVVEFETFGYDPQLGGTNNHVHFFFDTVPPSQAGVPGGGPWKLYPTSPGTVGTSPFTQYAVSDTPSGASEMCALVANADHSVIADSGTCMPLP